MMSALTSFEPPVALRPCRVDRPHGVRRVLQCVEHVQDEGDLPAPEYLLAGVPYPLRPVGDDDEFPGVVQARAAGPRGRGALANVGGLPASGRPPPRCL